MKYTSLGQRLKDLRTGKGLTQVALFRRSRISVSTIINAEKGHRAPQAGTLQALCRGLGISPAVLLHNVELTEKQQRRYRCLVQMFYFEQGRVRAPAW